MPSIINGVNAYCRYLGQSDRTDPRRIPAKIHLEDLGELSFTMYSIDAIGGRQHRIVPNDANRTFHYVRAPRDNPLDLVVDLDTVNKTVAQFCLIGASLGSALIAFSLSIPSLLGGLLACVFGAYVMHYFLKCLDAQEVRPTPPTAHA